MARDAGYGAASTGDGAHLVTRGDASPRAAFGFAFATFAVLYIGSPAILALSLPETLEWPFRRLVDIMAAGAVALAVYALVRLPAHRVLNQLRAGSPNELVVAVAMDGLSADYFGTGRGFAEVILRTSSDGLEVLAVRNPTERVSIVRWEDMLDVSAGIDGVIVRTKAAELYFAPSSIAIGIVLRHPHIRRRSHELAAAINARLAIHSPAV